MKGILSFRELKVSYRPSEHNKNLTKVRYEERLV